MRALARVAAASAALYYAAVNAQFELCALAMNDTTAEFFFAAVNNNTGALSPTFLELPELDTFGLGISAGADFGRYYTVSGNVSKQEDVLVVRPLQKMARYSQLVLPPEWSFLSLYGVGSLNIDRGTGRLLAMVLGYAPNGERYAFLGELADNGTVVSTLFNLTAAYRSWVYLYAGISAYDPSTGMYYLASVTGQHDYTTLYGFNTSNPSVTAPVVDVPFTWGVGDFVWLGFSDALRAQGAHGLVALVDDDNNSAAAYWLLTADGTNFTSLYQFPPNSLVFSGNNDVELSGDGRVAYSVFYDTHTPIANQVVIATDLLAGVERGRVAVQGSQQGTAIADIALCPPAN